MVFQCRHCLSILGDSFAWLTAQRSLSMIVLQDVTDRVDIQHAHPQSEEIDGEPSTFVPLICAKCLHTLGRMYQDTPPSLAHLRGAFSFHHDALVVYQLGSAGQHAPRPTAPAKPAAAPADHDEMEKVCALRTHTQIRTLLMVMGERLMRVEQYLHLSPSPAHDTPQSRS